MTNHRTSRLTILLTALLVGVAVWGASTLQRGAADSNRAHQAEAQRLLTGMLDMETAIRGYQLNGTDRFLAPFGEGMTSYERSHAALDAHTSGPTRETLHRADAAARRWQTLARRVIRVAERRGKGAVPGTDARNAAFTEFRRLHDELEGLLEAGRRDAATFWGIASAAIALLLALGLGLAGDRLVGRRERELARQRSIEAAYRETQTEFAETMQLAQSEQEAYDLVKRHLERSITDSDVVVFKRNNSADRLEPTTRVKDSALAERVEGADPSSCLAVRLGRTVARGSGDTPLLGCTVCGATSESTTCKPVVVGSEVIGSVLVTHHGPLAAEENAHLGDSIAQAAPALANLRNLAMAEARAATDALTGLPNRRAIEDTLKRMVAQASRTAQPLSALMIDLDHFKTINDLYGHEAGDEALAAVGALLRDALRESDFAGRQGGEEFIVLAPATDAVGAERLAENLRAAIEALPVSAIEHRLSASIGVATFPDAASGGSGLVRMADRALYAAKERGRNRVELATTV